MTCLYHAGERHEHCANCGGPVWSDIEHECPPGFPTPVPPKPSLLSDRTVRLAIIVLALALGYLVIGMALL